MPASTKISVVTPCFNGIHTVRETIESVLKQNYPAMEHLVIDGGSNDGTLDVLKEYGHITWISEKDEGHYHAMNKGISVAKGDVIGILNADDCYTAGALQAVDGAFLEHPEWDGVFGDVAFVDDKGSEILRLEEACWDYDVLRYGLCYISHPTLFVRRGVYVSLGSYLHKKYLNCCDYEFMLRMGKAGCRIGHIPMVVARYRLHRFGQSADRRVQRNMEAEVRAIKATYGVPGGFIGLALNFVMRAKRKFQVLFRRGKCEFLGKKRIIDRYMRDKTDFSSNIGIDKLDT